MKRALAITTVLAGTGLFLAAQPAQATPRGHDGPIAFRRYYNADHTRGDIFTIRSDGTGRRQVTRTRRTRLATEPDWSPGGAWIVYQVARHGDLDHSRLSKIRPSGRHRTFIDQSCRPPCRSDGFAQWAPHGRRLAFQRQFGPRHGPTALIALYVMRADGTHARRITHRGTDPLASPRFEDLAPTWSPSAARLAFERVDVRTGHHAIFTVRLDGSHVRRITPWRLDAAQPDWSPDGRWILFRSDETSDSAGNEWLVHPHGGGRHAVTHTRPGAGKWGSSSFSPSGDRIVASHSPGVGAAGNADVYTMELDGSHLRDITASPGFESAPDWGPR